MFIESTLSLSLSLSKLEILSSNLFIILMFVLDNFHLREDNHSQKNCAFPKDHGCTHKKTTNHVLQDNVTMFPRKSLCLLGEFFTLEQEQLCSQKIACVPLGTWLCFLRKISSNLCSLRKWFFSRVRSTPLSQRKAFSKATQPCSLENTSISY